MSRKRRAAWFKAQLIPRQIFTLVAAVSVIAGVMFAAVGDHREVAIPWLLVGITAAVGVLVSGRGPRR